MHISHWIKIPFGDKASGVALIKSERLQQQQQQKNWPQHTKISDLKWFHFKHEIFITFTTPNEINEQKI